MWRKLAKFGFIALVCPVLPQGILHPTCTWDNGKFPAPDRLSQERPSVSALQATVLGEIPHNSTD